MNGVYWIYGPDPNPGKQAATLPAVPIGFTPMQRLPLAIVLCPPGGRYLKQYLAGYKQAGIRTLVSMLSVEQVEMLELDEEPRIARQLGMEFLHHPLPDHDVPVDVSAFRSFVTALAGRFRRGNAMGIHCWGSIGRAPLTAACTLMHLGWQPRQALAAIEQARGCPVPDTEEQERWVLNYRAQE